MGLVFITNWYAKSHLAIDQGPIIVMIENYRSGLIWKLFMNIPDIPKWIKEIRFHEVNGSGNRIEKNFSSHFLLASSILNDCCPKNKKT